MLRDLAKQLRDMWQNGNFYQAVIEISDENRAAEIVDILNGSAHDFSADLIDFKDGQMRWHITFDGAVDNLVTEILESLSFFEVPVAVIGVSGNTIFLSERS